MSYPCPICGVGTVTTAVHKNFPTKVYGGIEIIVSRASVGHCNKCNEGFYNAKELKRWRELYLATLSDRMKIRIIGANGYGFLEGNDRADAALVKRGLIVDCSGGLMALTNPGVRVKTGLMQ